MAADPRTLRIAMGDDLTVAADGRRKAYEAIVWGMGETLMRLSPGGALVPWLAEGVENLDSLTWRVRLRRGARFWDGCPVDAEAVAASLRWAWATQPDAPSLIGAGTEVRVVDQATLELATPGPTGNVPNALAYHQFVVQRQDGTVMTGPYRPVACVPDRELTLEPFAGHWAGPPSIARIVVTVVADGDARRRSLERGAADIAYGLAPETLAGLGPDVEVASVASKKLHFVQFNHTRPPFDDRDVREAVALAIDREALVREGMSGHGAVATGMFPPYGGAETVPIQRTDVDAARRVLQRRGGGGSAFTLYSFPQRREMTSLARLIAGQLRPLGFDVTVREVPNIVAQTKGGDFSASMRSINALVTGDPFFLLQAMLARGARTNSGGYANPEVDEALRALEAESDPARRQAISRHIQEVAGADVPNAFLLFTPIVMAIRKGRLARFEVDPNNEYIVKHGMALAGEARGRR